MSKIKILEIKETNPILLPKKLGFGKIFTDRIFTQKFDKEAGWHTQ